MKVKLPLTRRFHVLRAHTQQDLPANRKSQERVSFARLVTTVQVEIRQKLLVLLVTFVPKELNLLLSTHVL